MREELDIRNVYKAVSHMSGLPEESLYCDGYVAFIDNLEMELKTRLIGQDAVINKLCGDLRQKQIEWFSSRDRQIRTLKFPATSLRPRFTGLMLGESGTGKTEAIKIIAGKLFNGNEIILRGQDVAPNNPHGTSAWVGAPPSYVGHGSGGTLTNGIRKSRFSCINFDEIEKASSIAVLEIMMGLLGEANITDMNTGASLDASQCMVFATSNIMIGEKRQKVGFAGNANDIHQKDIVEALLQYFPAELIARFNGIYLFKPLTVEEKWELLQRCIKKHIEAQDGLLIVKFDPKAEIFVRMELSRSKGGARGVQDFFSSSILPFISKQCSGSINITVDGSSLASDGL